MLKITHAFRPSAGFGLFDPNNYKGQGCQTDTDAACRAKARAQIDDGLAVLAMMSPPAFIAVMPIFKSWTEWAMKYGPSAAGKLPDYRRAPDNLDFLQARWFWRGQEVWDYAAHSGITLEELAIKYLPSPTYPFSARVSELYNAQSDDFKSRFPATVKEINDYTWRPLPDNEMIRMPYEAVVAAYNMGLTKPQLFANVTASAAPPKNLVVPMQKTAARTATAVTSLSTPAMATAASLASQAATMASVARGATKPAGLISKTREELFGARPVQTVAEPDRRWLYLGLAALAVVLAGGAVYATTRKA